MKDFAKTLTKEEHGRVYDAFVTRRNSVTVRGKSLNPRQMKEVLFYLGKPERYIHL